MPSVTKSLSVEQALALLPEKSQIHAIQHTPVSDIYGHWGRAIAETRVRESTLREIPNRIACSSGHGLVIKHGEAIYFIETKDGNHETRH